MVVMMMVQLWLGQGAARDIQDGDAQKQQCQCDDWGAAGSRKSLDRIHIAFNSFLLEVIIHKLYFYFLMHLRKPVLSHNETQRERERYSPQTLRHILTLCAQFNLTDLLKPHVTTHSFRTFFALPLFALPSSCKQNTMLQRFLSLAGFILLIRHQKVDNQFSSSCIVRMIVTLRRETEWMRF